MSSDFAIKVENLSKCYHIYDKPRDRLLQVFMPGLQRMAGRQPKQYYREFWALHDVSFEVKKGQTVGIIGKNGSGKSTLLQMICGTLTPTSGRIQTNGRVAALLELGAGFNPEFTGRENVFMNASILGLTKEEIDARFDDIATFADIGDFIEQPVKTYSSGMQIRLAFSVAISVEPDILVIDEALAVGDALFQKKCFTALDKLKSNGTTILFVSHDIWTVKSFTDKALLLNMGRAINYGFSPDVCLQYNKLLFGNTAKVPEKTNTTSDVVSVTPLNISQKYGTGCADLCKIEIIGLSSHNIIKGGEEITINCYCKWDIQQTSVIIKDKLLSDNISIGLLFRNVKHINVFGFNSLQKNMVLNTQLQNEACFSFVFTVPLLASGDYFISPAIAVGEQENHEILAWYDDIVHLKCNSDRKYIFGIFDIDTEIQIS
jgi:ABC-type polysaccharide/polyol phosphate transport system ATPase subunit